VKKILITGAGSYIGTSFAKWVAQYPDKYSVESMDMKDGAWLMRKICTAIEKAIVL
jgi:UDP-glucose 4-epimerase